MKFLQNGPENCLRRNADFIELQSILCYTWKQQRILTGPAVTGDSVRADVQKKKGEKKYG